MGYRAALPSAFATIATLTAMLGPAPCRADRHTGHRTAAGSKRETFVENLQRTKSLSSRHSARGARSVESADDRRAALESGRYAGQHVLSDSFFHGVIQISRKMGCRPRDLLAVMMRESGISARARNRASNAVGLIQFLPGTLAGLGWTGTPDGFHGLSAEQQLPWVERYLRPSSRYGLTSAARVYQAIFMPASLRENGGSDTTLLDNRGGSNEKYRRNRPLDINGDGRITVGELQRAIDLSCHSTEWHAIERRLRQLRPSRRLARDTSEPYAAPSPTARRPQSSRRVVAEAPPTPRPETNPAPTPRSRRILVAEVPSLFEGGISRDFSSRSKRRLVADSSEDRRRTVQRPRAVQPVPSSGPPVPMPLEDLEEGRGVRMTASRQERTRDAEPDAPSAGAESGNRGDSTIVAARSDWRTDAGSQLESAGVSIDLRTTEGLAAALKALGYDDGPAPVGAALRAFQRREGLKADGIAGLKTRAALTVRLNEAGLAATL